jgi:hypothetical protein
MAHRYFLEWTPENSGANLPSARTNEDIMLDTIEVHGPTSEPSDRRRAAESRKAAESIARQVIIQMIKAGWRESEAALSLADAFDDYCLYLAERPPLRHEAANTNKFSVAS